MSLFCAGAVALLYHEAAGRRSRTWYGLPLVAVLAAAPAAGFDIEGHRGARGLAPENTLAGFAAALAVGVTTLEMDLGVTRDGVLVVIHDQRLSPAIARGPDGRWLRRPTPAVHDLTLAELRTFDVGRIDPASRYARGFPAQRAVDGERVPTLAEVVDLTGRAGNGTVRFNLETKSDPGTPELAPDPALFARLLVDEIDRLGIASRVTVQSFDWRTLQAVKALAPDLPTACLTSQQTGFDTLQRGQSGASPWTAGLDLDEHASVPDLVRAAGCTTWSPSVDDLHALTLGEAHSLGLRVVPWTVNEPAMMEALIEGNADGIITDEPHVLRDVAARLGLPVPSPTPVPD